ncbi:unnamed protein product [Brassicogethes aeneus]|uniref:Uncharacterized protein n=1 Tax=Brassicogethes aeneus TaxID=1431903 RepID=A0A9P0FP53_BRAAE|nr:unnamed protein product [Brassicogethes aeneus]
MARDRRALTSFELQVEAEQAADELHNYENMSDDFSDYSNSDLDPTYEQTDATCSSESDNEPNKIGKLIFLIKHTPSLCHKHQKTLISYHLNRRESIGLPFGLTPQPLFFYNNPPSPTSSSGTFRANTPPSRFTPYERSSTPDDTQNSNNDTIQLSIILDETSRGNILVHYYNKFSMFQEEQRSSLISLVAFYFEEKGIKMTLSSSHQMERQILERFPTEKIERVVPGFTSKQFQQHFRITIDAYEHQLNVMGPQIMSRQDEVGMPNINAEKQLLAVIWLLATPDSYRSVGEY